MQAITVWRRRLPGQAQGRLAVMLAFAGLVLPVAVRAQQAPTPQPAAPPATPNQPAPTTQDTTTQEDWAIHGQTTATWMLQPGFASPYQGPQSLSPAANGRETVDMTAYLGVRPWSGAELWINPEIPQGYGLSNDVGVAGYLSGESDKVGSQDPYFLIQRLFLRQTIDLGGATQQLPADLNQLAGSQTADRIVITAGKISIPDVFDTNSYAHDARHDFLNWSVIDQGSFDYAANSWGYTYGAAVEWYQDWWTIRQGLFNMPNLPNGKNIDPRILGQFESITELEERHNLWGQPGKVKFLYWIDRGELGLYDEAVALGALTRQIPTTANVRNYRTKDGVEINMEQQVMDGLGVFMRAGASQGSVEEDAFTEINQSISGGVSMTGARWSRPDDTVAAAFVVNQISRAGKQYLAAGGLGGIIGDGRLPNAGPEQILETYYDAAVYKYTQLTLDYQAVNHPAYNRDRGPVSVFSFRLHLQF